MIGVVFPFDTAIVFSKKREVFSAAYFIEPCRSMLRKHGQFHSTIIYHAF